MEPLYSETYLPARPSAKRKLLRGALMFLGVLFVLFGLFSALFLQTIIVFVIMFIMAFLVFFFLPTTKIAYEYIFVDGQIDFDRILKGEKRKTMKRIDMEKVEIVAPEKSHHLDYYRNHPLVDYSSGNPDDTHYIAVALVGEKGLERVRFTPDEKMLTMIGRKSPSKLKSE